MWKGKEWEGENEQLFDLHINIPVMFAVSVVFCFVFLCGPCSPLGIELSRHFNVLRGWKGPCALGSPVALS